MRVLKWPVLGALLVLAAACTKNTPPQQASAPNAGGPAVAATTTPPPPPPVTPPTGGAANATGFLAVGTEAPDIVGEDTDGKPMKLSDYRGKVVVLDFWGHW